MKKVSIDRSHALTLTNFGSEIMITCIEWLDLFPFDEVMAESL